MSEPITCVVMLDETCKKVALTENNSEALKNYVRSRNVNPDEVKFEVPKLFYFGSSTKTLIQLHVSTWVSV